MKNFEGVAMPMAAFTLAMATSPAVLALGTTDGMPRADDGCRT